MEKREAIGIVGVLSIIALGVESLLYVVVPIEDPVARLVPGIATCALEAIALISFAEVYLMRKMGIGTIRTA